MWAEVCSWLGDWPLSLPLYTSPPLRPSVHPFLSVWVYNNGVKHLWLPGNYGWAKTAGSALLTSSGTPQLALHLHLPSLCHSPDDHHIIPLKRPERRTRAKRENRQMSDLRGAAVVGDEDSHSTESHVLLIHSIRFVWNDKEAVTLLELIQP